MENEKRTIDAAEKIKIVALKKLIWKIPILIVGVFLSFLLFLSLVLTFNFTKSFLFNLALNVANDSFNGKISFESANFNPFRGIILNNVLVSLNSDTIAHFNKILLDWDLGPIFQRNIFVKKIVFYNPKINLVKELGDTLWNFQKFFKPSKDESSPSKTNLHLLINSFELKNGNFKLVDKNHHSNSNYFDHNNLWIDNANIELSAAINFLTKEYAFAVRNVSLVEKNSNLSLEKLSGKLNIDSSSVEINDLVVATTNSNIVGSVVYSTSNSVLNINLTSSLINTSEIKKFSDLPIGSDIPIKLKGEIKIGENIEFKYVTANLDSKNFFTVDGFLKASGEPSVELQISNLQIYEKEIRRIIPDFWGDLNLNFGYISSRIFYFYYRNHNIYVRGDFVSKAARFKTDLSIDSQNIMNYKIAFQNVDLGYLLPKLPRSNMSGKSQGEVRLSNLDNLNGNFSLEISSGKLDLKGFENFKIFVSSFVRNGVINIDTLNFFHFHGTKEQKIGYLGGNGIVDISQKNDVNYSFDLHLTALPLNSFFEEPNYLPESISGRFRFEGKRFDLNSIYLDLNAQLEEFAFSDKSILPFYITININHLDTANKHISIESDILRGNIKGNYNLLSLVDGFMHQFTSIAKDFECKFENVFKSKNENDGAVVNLVSATAEVLKCNPLLNLVKQLEQTFT